MKYLMREGRLYRILLVLGIVLWQTGCASLGVYNPATGKKEFIFISTRSEVSMGRDVHRQLTKQYKIISGTDQARRFQRIGRTVALASDRQDYTYHFYLIDKDEMNAFTTPGGNIYIFSGLVEKLGTDNAIASVLAHEIGHCAAKHTVKKFQAALGYNLIGNIIMSQVGGERAREIASMSTSNLMGLVFSAYGRQDEYEADRLGLKYMAAVNYKLEGMIEAFEVLKKEEKGGSVPLMLRSHPFLDDRIIAAREEITRIRGLKRMTLEGSNSLY